MLTPYMVPFGRAVAEGLNRRVVLVCGSQMGKSDTILDLIGHRLDQAPAPILYVGPTQQFISDQWEPRIMGLLDEAPTIKAKVARGKRMKKARKVIAGVPLRLAHAGSSTALKSDPAALALTDEADELMANVKGQGNPIGLVDRRGDTYADFVHAIVSTPSEGLAETEVDPETGLEFWKEADPEDVSSTIWRFWQGGTRYHWAWPCPHCDEYFVPRFKCLDIPQGSPAEARAKTVMMCPKCGAAIDDGHKAAMNERGLYVAQGQRIENGVVLGDPPESETISFWVSGLCSPFRSFGDRAAEFVEALRSGDPSQVQTVINGGFGELWRPANGEAPEWQEVAKLRRAYPAGSVPKGALWLTAGVDVQKNRLVYVVRGWGARASSWLVQHGELWGATDEDEVWASLSNVLQDSYSGMHIARAFVDAGFRPNKRDAGSEHRVYSFVRRFPRQVFASKGASTALVKPIVSSKIEVRANGKPYGIELQRLDTDFWKSWVHTHLRWPEDQPGAFALHETTTDDYCQQLVSEARVKTPTGKAQWVQRSRNNHYLDCEAMAAAAAYKLNVQTIPEGASREWEAETEEHVPAAHAEARTAAPPPSTSLRDRFASKATRFRK